jgi:hypothetical protein
MRTTNLTRRRGVRSTALISAVVLAASGIFATMGTAGAVITSSAGENADGTPRFLRDARGMALALCTDANVNACEPAVDDHIGVYFAAEANTPHLRANWGVEAVENGDNPGGAPLVSNGARFRLNGLRPNTRYTIKDPWGTTTVRTNASGSRDFRIETNGRIKNLSNGHVKTFLRAPQRNASAFIGSANLTSRVVGSPTGFNRVRLMGPGSRSWSTGRFTLMGEKRADTAMSMVSRKSLQLGNGSQSAVIQRSVGYSSFGTAAARPRVSKGGLNPAAFSVQNRCGSQAPGTRCSIVVTFRPSQNANSIKRAFLRIDDNGLAAPRRVSLRGVGVRR